VLRKEKRAEQKKDLLTDMILMLSYFHDVTITIGKDIDISFFCISSTLILH